MANGDLLSTNDLVTASDLLGHGIFFTMGCHAGFQTTDAIVGSNVLDWPQFFAQSGTAFVGNTGFGLGNTDSVAFSEELMTDFAGNLDGSQSIGEALVDAKRSYYLSRVAFSSYDDKTLSEAELYGLPMYGVGQSPTALQPAAIQASAQAAPATVRRRKQLHEPVGRDAHAARRDQRRGGAVLRRSGLHARARHEPR